MSLVRASIQTCIFGFCVPRVCACDVCSSTTSTSPLSRLIHLLPLKHNKPSDRKMRLCCNQKLLPLLQKKKSYRRHGGAGRMFLQRGSCRAQYLTIYPSSSSSACRRGVPCVLGSHPPCAAFISCVCSTCHPSPCVSNTSVPSAGHWSSSAASRRAVFKTTRGPLAATPPRNFTSFPLGTKRTALKAAEPNCTAALLTEVIFVFM